MNLSYYFILFLIYSFLGWVIEVFFTCYKDRNFVNRGFLIGPYCPIYGYGCIFMILLLDKYLNDPIVLFIMAVVICSILEYLTSFLMEKIFKARWWDYSERKFNINGRICLETLIPFGLLGCLLMYVLNPLISSLLLKMPHNIIIILSIMLFIIFMIDNIISYFVISKISISRKKVVMDNTEEITKKVREYISNNSKLGKRLMKSFPSLKLLRNMHSKDKKK